MADTIILRVSDYPHLDGTPGHTHETLQGLFDGIDEELSQRIRFGAFEDLFPSAPKLSANRAG